MADKRSSSPIYDSIIYDIISTLDFIIGSMVKPGVVRENIYRRGGHNEVV
ncbi:hypothetical protein [Halobacillus dabanensis]|nr:hypothetical protein [Halobacillus dabanensis]